MLTKNKMVPGKFKDECAGRPVAEIVAPSPKMYSILEASGANTKRAKGVQRIVVKKDLHHDLYKQCLEEGVEMRHRQVVIRSHRHQMGVYEQVKTSLSKLDTKQWIAPEGVTTRAYGHYLIAQEERAAHYYRIAQEEEQAALKRIQSYLTEEEQAAVARSLTELLAA